MRLLLDTHALLWWLNDDRRLGTPARSLIADPDNTVLVSTVSLWEIVIKVRVGTLEAESAEIADVVARQGFALLAIDPHHLIALDGLPLHPDHRDPFDHLLTAQAIAEGATFVSEDGNAPRYPVHLMRCSDVAQPPGRGRAIRIARAFSGTGFGTARVAARAPGV